MKVIDWISYEEAEKRKEVVGSFGGFFDNGMRWQNYLEHVESSGLHLAAWTTPEVEYLEAIRASVLEKQLRLTGQDHQYSEHGVPVFDDGTVAMFSYRGWGDLMAAIWSEAEDTDYNYMDFYM